MSNQFTVNILHISLIITYFFYFPIGHFLLTELLLEKMIDTARQTGVEGRIVNVSSVIHSWVKKDHFDFNRMLQPKQYVLDKNGTS